MAENTQNLKSTISQDTLDFYKRLIASDRRAIKSRKEFIKQSRINLKRLKAEKGNNSFIEYFSERIIKDSEFIKEAQDRIKERKQTMAELETRREDQTTNFCLEWNKNIQEIMENLKDIENILDSTKRRQGKPKPELRVIKGGLCDNT